MNSRANWPVWISRRMRFISCLVPSGDEAWAARQVAVLAVSRSSSACWRYRLVDEVDDQLHLVQALEVGHLRRVAGLDPGLEPV